MTQPPVPPPAWGGPAAPGQPNWQQSGPVPTWQPQAAPPVPRQPGPPPFEQRPGPPAGPPPGAGPYYGTPPKQSKKGLWWGLGALIVAVLVGAGVLVYVFVLGGVEAPTGVSAAAQEDGVAVTWTAVDGATSYEIFRNDVSLGTTGETTFLDAEPPGGTEVTYTVVASDADGEKSEAGAASAFVTPLNPPTSLEATVDDADVLLTWDAVTGAETYTVTANGSPVTDGLTEPNYTHQSAPMGDTTYEVTAVDADGEGSTASATVNVFAPGPWGDAYQIGQAFTELVGAEPGGDAWNGATCSSQPDGSSVAHIRCDYANGLFIDVRQFSDVAAKDDNAAAVAEIPGVGTGTWSYGGGEAQGDLYLSAEDATDAFRLITFYESDLELFTIWCEWDGHSQDELRDAWFTDAPF